MKLIQRACQSVLQANIQMVQIHVKTAQINVFFAKPLLNALSAGKLNQVLAATRNCTIM